MSTVSEEKVEFDQEEMKAIVRLILLGEHEKAQVSLAVLGAVGGTITGRPSHWTRNNRDRLEGFVLVCDRYFSTTSTQMCQYFAVMYDREGNLIIPYPKGVVLPKREGMPLHHSELVRQGLYSGV